MSAELGISACEVWAARGVCLTDVDQATFPPLVCLQFLNHNYHAALRMMSFVVRSCSGLNPHGWVL